MGPDCVRNKWKAPIMKAFFFFYALSFSVNIREMLIAQVMSGTKMYTLTVNSSFEGYLMMS